MLKDGKREEIARHLERLQWYLDRGYLDIVNKSLDKLEEDVDRNSDATRKIKVTYEQSA